MAKRFFIPIRNILKTILDLDVDDMALQIANTNELKTLVIRLNTEGEATSQLYELGEDSLGRVLKGKRILKDGIYTPFTLREKREKGQRLDHPTLKDTGGFYASFKVIPFKGGFNIEANPIVGDTNLFNELGEEIVGLNSENLQIVINLYREKLQERVNTLLDAA